MTPVAQVSLRTGEPCPAQLRAWAALWQCLLGPQETNAPEACTPEASERDAVASAPRHGDASNAITSPTESPAQG